MYHCGSEPVADALAPDRATLGAHRSTSESSSGVLSVPSVAGRLFGPETGRCVLASVADVCWRPTSGRVFAAANTWARTVEGAQAWPTIVAEELCKVLLGPRALTSCSWQSPPPPGQGTVVAFLEVSWSEGPRCWTEELLGPAAAFFRCRKPSPCPLLLADCFWTQLRVHTGVCAWDRPEAISRCPVWPHPRRHFETHMLRFPGSHLRAT